MHENIFCKMDISFPYFFSVSAFSCKFIMQQCLLLMIILFKSTLPDIKTMLACIRRSIASRCRKVILLLCWELMKVIWNTSCSVGLPTTKRCGVAGEGLCFVDSPAYRGIVGLDSFHLERYLSTCFSEKKMQYGFPH